MTDSLMRDKYFSVNAQGAGQKWAQMRYRAPYDQIKINNNVQAES